MTEEKTENEENEEVEEPPPTTTQRISCISAFSFSMLIFFTESVCLCFFFQCWTTHLTFSTHFLPGRTRGAWSLVCETEEQWLSLAESIKDKTSLEDRHLYRVISQNFLPEISSMIEHKVRSHKDATSSLHCNS